VSTVKPNIEIPSSEIWDIINAIENIIIQKNAREVY